MPKPSEVVVAFLNGLLVEVKPEVEVETVEVILVELPKEVCVPTSTDPTLGCDVDGSTVLVVDDSDCILCNSFTVLSSTCILSYRNFSLSIMLSSFSFITFRCLSRKSSVSFGALPEIKEGDSDAGDKVFRALRTSRWISVSKGELLEIDCVRCGVGVGGVGGGVGVDGIGIVVLVVSVAAGTAFLRASLLRCCSRSLHRVVRISTVSSRSFFSEAKSVIFSRQASRSTLRFSFSNSAGVRARVCGLLLFLALVGGFGAGGTGAVTDAEDIEGSDTRGTFEEGTIEDTAEVFDEDTGVFKGVVGDSCGHRGTEGESSVFGE